MAISAPVADISGGLARLRFRDDHVAGPHSTVGRPDALAELRRLISMATTSIDLASGDGYLVHNHRILHGRSVFAGSRRLARILARVNDDHPYTWLNRGFRVANPKRR